MRPNAENRLSRWPQSLYAARDPSEPESLRDRARNWEYALEQRMGDHPKATLAVAAMLGFFLGWLVKRK
jgi:ElaB/YqjD/DUF883 family membrane-anchored ribosome-binding protein